MVVDRTSFRSMILFSSSISCLPFISAINVLVLEIKFRILTIH